MIKVSALLSLALCLVACQQTNDLSKTSKPDYCHHIQKVDYNLYEVLKLGMNGDFSDMVIANQPLLSKNAFKNIELVNDPIITENISLNIKIKDDGIIRSQPSTPSIALVVDGKKVQFFNVYDYLLEKEMTLSFANNDLALSTFEQLKFVNCQQ
ncbi:hypothetical protein [Moraxella oblonga]|uniref:hypothetical protein n=1 Tax=Moraxella oblonga TaxID=200413 RepID=UPI00082FF0A1|nr:hypothetical protein [Moraxella oblonga]